MTTEDVIRTKYEALASSLNERTRRLWAATEAAALGRGGIALVMRATGMAFNTIHRGMREMDEPNAMPPGRVRRPGGGRKKATTLYPGLGRALDRLVEPATRGDPQSPLRWTCKSTRRLAGELKAMGYSVSHVLVASLLAEQGYSLQANRKTKEGTRHRDRNLQFEHINRRVRARLRAGEPAISVDTKKKELVGNFENKGRQWRKAKEPERVNGHDFPAPSLPRAYPYGIYYPTFNRGFVNVGTDHDTAAFAVASIKGWWRHEGRRLYPGATRLLITADGGGSNGYRLRLWKLELQALADAARLTIAVCHFPPGTSKWNKVEHRLFSFISSNWRGEPLRDYETIVHLIAATTTAKGLSVTCRLDHRKYPTGRKVTDEEMATVLITPHTFHGEWNYVIRPREK